MSLLDLIRLLVRNWKLLTIIPVVLGGTIFYLTRNETKVYSSDTTIYTGIASGYTIQGNADADFFQIGYAFDNMLNMIASRHIHEEVAVQLLASHLMLEKHDANVLGWKAYEDFRKAVPDSLAKTIRKATQAETAAAIRARLKRGEEDPVYLLLNGDAPYYSIKALSKISAMRLNSSDLIKIQYEVEDAAICQHTLEILTEVFMKNRRELREGQTESVIRYFEAEVAAAQKKLSAAEQKFLAFNKNNNIINYYEQTKYISAEKEELYDKYNGLEMDYAGAYSSMLMLEEKLQNRTGIKLNAEEIVSYRTKLSKISSELANMELYAKDSSDERIQNRIEDLRSQAAQVSTQIRQSVESMFKNTHSINGLPSKELLDDWVKNALTAEETKSRLSIMDKRKAEFQEVYERMAPLGATLKRIEREIDIAEKEYLSMLNGLNLSRLMQQSNELASNLKVIDEPYYPLKAKGSKRMILVIAGGFGAFVVIAALLIAMEMMDKNLKKLSRAAKQIGLPMFGIYPLMLKGSTWNKFLNRVEELLVQQLLLKKGQSGKQGVYTVAFLSMQTGEGKTTIAREVAYKLRKLNQRTVVAMPDDHAEKIEKPTDEDAFYAVVDNLIAVRSWSELAGRPVEGNVDFLFLEIPSLLENTYPVSLLKEVDLILAIARANRTWRAADNSILAQLKKLTQVPVELLLNGVDPENTEEWIGEVPKKRSLLRMWLKRILKFEFKKKLGFKL